MKQTKTKCCGMIVAVVMCISAVHISETANCIVQQWYQKMIDKNAFSELSTNQITIRDTILNLIEMSNNNNKTAKLDCAILDSYEEMLLSEQNNEEEEDESTDLGDDTDIEDSDDQEEEEDDDNADSVSEKDSEHGGDATTDPDVVSPQEVQENREAYGDMTSPNSSALASVKWSVVQGLGNYCSKHLLRSCHQNVCCLLQVLFKMSYSAQLTCLVHAEIWHNNYRNIWDYCSRIKHRNRCDKLCNFVMIHTRSNVSQSPMEVHNQNKSCEENASTAPLKSVNNTWSNNISIVEDVTREMTTASQVGSHVTHHVIKGEEIMGTQSVNVKASNNTKSAETDATSPSSADGKSDTRDERQTKNMLDIEIFRALVDQKTGEYHSKILTMETQIIKLENLLLTEKLQKQNNTSSFGKLENQILKLENDLLRMKQAHDELKRENEYILAAHRSFVTEMKELAKVNVTKYPALSDNSAKEIKKIAVQDETITELKYVVQNQSSFIHQLRNQSEMLEQQNRLLHQIVMNQTLVVADMMTKVQQISQDNLKHQMQQQDITNKVQFFLDLNKIVSEIQPKMKKTQKKVKKKNMDSPYFYDIKRLNKLIKITSQRNLSNSHLDTCYLPNFWESLIFKICIPDIQLSELRIGDLSTKVNCSETENMRQNDSLPDVVPDLSKPVDGETGVIKSDNEYEKLAERENLLSPDKQEIGNQPLVETTVGHDAEKKSELNKKMSDIKDGAKEDPQRKENKTVVDIIDNNKENTHNVIGGGQNVSDENKPKISNVTEKISVYTEKSNSDSNKEVIQDNVQETKKKNGTKSKGTKAPMKFDIPPILYQDENQKEPKDCYDLYKEGKNTNGQQRILLRTTQKRVQVDCDMKQGGWTVIQRRQNGKVDFYRDWKSYKKGFGDLYGEHWIGNDKLHILTNQDHYSLRVELHAWNKTRRWAEYDYFMVGQESDGYKLYITGYSGDAGDGLSKHNLEKFSTKDVDNDRVEKEFDGSCARRFQGAWWYYKCYASNLNGVYYKDGVIPTKKFDGVTWKAWTGPNYSLKKVVMMVRPMRAKLPP